MIKEAIEYLVDVARNGDAPNLLLGNAQRKVYLNAQGQNEITKNRWADHIVKDVDTLGIFSTDICEFWYDEEAIVLVLDPTSDLSKPAGGLAMNLTATEQHEFLFSGKWWNQKAFVRLLRSHCSKAFVPEQDSSLIQVLSSLRFASTMESEATVTNSKESMGTSIKREASGAGNIPEGATLLVQRWNEFDFHVEVEFFLDIDFERENLRLTPVGTSLLGAKRSYKDYLLEQIEGVNNGSTVCHGQYRIANESDES